MVGREGWRVHDRWTPRRRHAIGYRAQHNAIARQAGDDELLFWKNGKYAEFYGAQRLRAQAILGLRPTPLPRAGYGWTAGFPLRLVRQKVESCVRQGVTCVLIPGQAEDRRVPAVVYAPR